MRNLLFVMALALPLSASAQQQTDGSQYNYYGNDAPRPPEPERRDDQRHEDWRRVHGLNGQPPPPPRPEARPPATSPGQLWIGGYWMPRGNEHVWVPGHYAFPPAPGYAWESPRWQNENGAWVFYEGHWFAGAPVQPAAPYQPPPVTMEDVWTDQQPPPPMAEYQSPMPFAGAIWIPGYWHWNGIRFGWVAGRWSAHPPWYVWEPHRWVRSADGHFREDAGHWRR